LCRHLGFRTDLGLQAVLDGTTMQVIRTQRVTPLGLGNLVECVNRKAA
jgi:phosphatidylethanolamine/phosphatidyl-N-methylethanolamine N-methyltransferase